MKATWKTQSYRDGQVVYLQGGVCLRGNSTAPVMLEKGFIAHDYGGSDG